MKTSTLIAAALSLLGSSLAYAAGSSTTHGESADIKSLRADCASQHQVSFEAPAADNEYRFVYAKGEYRGDAADGKSLKCTESQYVAYLDNADPVRVMNAYPTAAGRPTAKKDQKDQGSK